MDAVSCHTIEQPIEPLWHPRKAAAYLCLHEKTIITGIGNEAIKVMVAVAATTGMRRSEVCGLKWSDCLLDQRWFELKRGVVHNVKVADDGTGQRKRKSRPVVTRLKTKASRKGVPMNEDLAELLAQWRKQTPYPSDDGWVFASHT